MLRLHVVLCRKTALQQHPRRQHLHQHQHQQLHTKRSISVRSSMTMTTMTLTTTTTTTATTSNNTLYRHRRDEEEEDSLRLFSSRRLVTSPAMTKHVDDAAPATSTGGLPLPSSLLSSSTTAKTAPPPSTIIKTSWRNGAPSTSFSPSAATGAAATTANSIQRSRSLLEFSQTNAAATASKWMTTTAAQATTATTNATSTLAASATAFNTSPPTGRLNPNNKTNLWNPFGVAGGGSSGVFRPQFPPPQPQQQQHQEQQQRLQQAPPPPSLFGSLPRPSFLQQQLQQQRAATAASFGSQQQQQHPSLTTPTISPVKQGGDGRSTSFQGFLRDSPNPNSASLSPAAAAAASSQSFSPFPSSSSPPPPKGVTARVNHWTTQYQPPSLPSSLGQPFDRPASSPLSSLDRLFDKSAPSSLGLSFGKSPFPAKNSMPPIFTNSTAAAAPTSSSSTLPFSFNRSAQLASSAASAVGSITPAVPPFAAGRSTMLDFTNLAQTPIQNQQQPFLATTNTATTTTSAAATVADTTRPFHDVQGLRIALSNALLSNQQRSQQREQQNAEQRRMQQQLKFQRQRQPFAISSLLTKKDIRPSWRNDDDYSKNLSRQYRKRKEMELLARERDAEERLAATERRQQRQLQRKMEDEGYDSYETTKRQRQRQRQSKGLAPGSIVQLPDRSMDLNELSQLFQVKLPRLKQILHSLGSGPGGDGDLSEMTASSYPMVDLDMMELVAMELEYQPVRSPRRRRRVLDSQSEDDRETLLQRRSLSEAVDTAQLYQSYPSRPPVVCIMGHVDHGKTTLMDSLRRRSRQAMLAAAAEATVDGETSSTTTATTTTTTTTTKTGKGGSNNSSSSSKKDSTTKGDVAGTEAGGITQAISAFQIKLENDPTTAVTFLDTPGHAAFRAMRESGTQAADVIVLVIAADDGVSKQTIEIINFYKILVKEAGPSGISLVIAMNKIDKDGIDVQESRARIMNQLMEHDIFTEDVGSAGGESEYGPPVQLVPVSGLTGLGLDELIESLALQSEVMDLRADVDAQAEGLVMEASVDQGLGVTANCIVRWGSLQRGDVVVSGTSWGKVKILRDVHDAPLDKALPSQPIQVVGFHSIPKAGDPFVCVASEEIAKQLTERRQALQAVKNQTMSTLSLPTALTVPAVKAPNTTDGDDGEDGDANDAPKRRGPKPSQVELVDESGSIRIPMLVKADTDAALEAVRESLKYLADESSHPIVLDWVSTGVGPITTADVRVAKQAGASIFTFGLGSSKRKNDIRKLMDTEGVESRDHTIIYELMDDAKKRIAKYLPPVMEEVVHGRGRVLATFNIKGNHVAGMKILDGKVAKDKVTLQGSALPCYFRVLRDGECIFPPPDSSSSSSSSSSSNSNTQLLKAASLKQVKDDVPEVKKGDECGLVLEDYDDIQVNDVIECYSTRINHVFS